MTHSEIIDKFGGIRKLAAALGHKSPTTVQGWAKNGIPRWRIHEILEASRKKRLGIKIQDFSK